MLLLWYQWWKHGRHSEKGRVGDEGAAGLRKLIILLNGARMGESGGP